MITIYPDEEVLLITWDHGSVFGIFRQTAPDMPVPAIRLPIDDQIDRYPYLKTLLGQGTQGKTVP